MIKPVAYFVIGLFAGLIVSELMKDAKPVNRIDLYDSHRMRYKHPPRYPYGYDYYYRPLEYRSVIRTQSNTRNDEKRSGGTTGTTTFDHTPQQRTESWGTKN